ncbi:MoeA, N-terminal and linker domain-containing protein [Aspergillus californicus]
MAIPYEDAARLLRKEARCQTNSFLQHTETSSIYDSCERIASETVYSPIRTPHYDTSAMDGFALSSSDTQLVSPDNRVTFEVHAITTAGNEPYSLNKTISGVRPCVEVMTGAPFPTGPDGEQYDCCVPIENVRRERQYISVSKPPMHRQHRRCAGGDFQKGDFIVKPAERITPQHVLSMASVGISKVPVLRKPRVVVFSTGCELLSAEDHALHEFMIHDANGPYLTTMLRKHGVDVDLGGVVHDEPNLMEHALVKALQNGYDMVLTSSAVSAGRCDVIPDAVNRMGGRTVFHRVAVKPGHPIFFSIIPDTETPIFGLPGNPVAAAACLRFFVLPYLQCLQLQPTEEPQFSRLQVTKDVEGPVKDFRKEVDIFRPAILSPCKEHVQIIEDHSPGKTKPFLLANCWVHIPRGVSALRDNDLVAIYPC